MPEEKTEKKETMFEVTISVVYNSVDQANATGIIAETMKTHEDACKVEVVAKKAARPFIGPTYHFVQPAGTINSEAAFAEGR